MSDQPSELSDLLFCEKSVNGKEKEREGGQFG